MPGACHELRTLTPSTVPFRCDRIGAVEGWELESDLGPPLGGGPINRAQRRLNQENHTKFKFSISLRESLLASQRHTHHGKADPVLLENQ